MDEGPKKTRQRHPRCCVNKRNATHDCAFLEPLAFPPDLPPVILMDWICLMEKDEVSEFICLMDVVS